MHSSRSKTAILAALVAVQLCSCGSGKQAEPTPAAAAPSAAPSGADNGIDGLEACLQQGGLQTTRLPDGGLESRSPKGMSQEKAATISQQCSDKFNPSANGYTADKTQLPALYEGLVSVNDCMRSHGFPTSDAPTLDTFVASSGQWDPYIAVLPPPLKPGQRIDVNSPKPVVPLEELTKACPKPTGT